MSEPNDFQTIILTLQDFWVKQGCVIWQPYYTQVGAGTMNPATYLRVLGPEPWNVGYVEPSVRPDDGRYGKNPNRLQQHYQFQVILKPDPGNPQELYLQSLIALGIDPRRHDIRFVEDNWESPALGAWGLGWEVWLDGQEITQFTYFQQAGGLMLDPVSIEITYGLERIAMPLQHVRNFSNIRWGANLTYGDIHLKGEQEHSKYYFEVADVGRVRQMYDLFEQEAEIALEQGLVLPAHDYILKCSHTFNILDTRGAIGVTERQALFGRMRDLSRRTAEAYLAQRQQLNFPWIKSGKLDTKATSQPNSLKVEGLAEKVEDFLVEIGTEELPATDLQSSIEQLAEKVPTLLDNLRLAHGEVHVMGTPRRLVVYVKKLAEKQADRTMIVKGPPANRAFDSQGQPTSAAIGFAKSKGMDVHELENREVDGGIYLTAVVHESGKAAIDVLVEALPGLLAGLKFDKSMRWNASNVAFSRPIRWLLGLLGETVVPFCYAGLQSGNTTRGLRFNNPEEFVVASPSEYFNALQLQGIRLDPQERRDDISTQVKQLMQSAGGAAKLDEGLLDEITQLVEAPKALLCQFDASFLEIPAAVLISVMKKHQRYFPIYNENGDLFPNFIAVRNGNEQNLDIVADGNEQVIGARFSDAAFFITEDLKHKIEDFLPRLGTLVFQIKLGTMLDKTRRIEKLVDRLAEGFGLSGDEKINTLRAAHLCKADLVSHMVIEMTSVQGAMGRHYALQSGENQAVADAIYEHYLPRFSGDDLPVSSAGFIVGLADRLDSLAGLFAAGLAPSGTKDPFALRRTAIGLVQTLIMKDIEFDLSSGLALAAENLPINVTPQTLSDCLDFIGGRLQSTMLDQGYRYDVVDAVAATQAHNPANALRAVRSLSQWVRREDWDSVLPAYARCVRITREMRERFEINPGAFVAPEEEELFKSLMKAENESRRKGSIDDFFSAFLPLISPINLFFDAVLVMAEEPTLRANRLGMLQRIAALTEGVADFSKLEGF